MKRIHVLFFFVFFYLIIINLSYADGIIHTRIDKIIADQPAQFTVELEGITSNVEVVIYYKIGKENLYNEASMLSIGNNVYTTTLTPVFAKDDVFSYYIAVKMDNKLMLSLPEVNPKEYPFIVNVTSDEFTPKVRFLTPANNEVVRNGFPCVLLTFDDELSQLDMKTFKMTINGEDVTDYVSLSQTFANYVPKKELKEDVYSIKVTIKDVRGKVHSINSSFTFRRKDQDFLTYNGSLSLDNYFYNTDKYAEKVIREPFESEAVADINLKSWILNSNINVKRDSKESSDNQPLNRVSFGIWDDKKNIDIKCGDTNPVMSNMALNGMLVQGNDIDLDVFGVVGLNKLVKIKYISGITRKAIDTSSTANMDNVSYEQDISAYKISTNLFGFENNVSYMHIKDNENSLPLYSSLPSSDRLLKPRENHVVSVENNMRLFDLTDIKLETAASVYYSDSTAGSINVSDLNLPIKEETIKQYEKTIPIKSSPGFGAATNLEVRTPVLFRELTFKGGTKWAHPSFTSLGSSSVKKDNFEYSGELGVRLLKNLFSLRGGIKKQNDNVMQSASENTTYTLGYNVDSTLVIPNVAILYLGFNNSDKENKTNDNEVVTGDRRVSNKLLTVMMGIGGITFDIASVANKININYNYNKYTDDAITVNSFDATAFGINYQTEILPFKLKVDFSRSDKLAKSTTPNTTTYTTLGGKAFYDVIPKIFTSYAGLKLSKGYNNGNDIAKRIDNTNMTLTVGGSYKFDQQAWIFYDSLLTVNWDLITLTDAKSKSEDVDYRDKNFSESILTLKVSTVF